MGILHITTPPNMTLLARAAHGNATKHERQITGRVKITASRGRNFFDWTSETIKQYVIQSASPQRAR